MKKTLFLGLFSLMMLAAKAQQITLAEVPPVVQEKFKSEHSDIPEYIKPNWYLDKAVGSEKALFKVSYMVANGFESYLYSHSGQEVYRIKDYYKAALAPQTVVTNMKAAYPASAPAKVSEYSSAKYNTKGYIVTFENYKTKYADANGVLTLENPATTFSQKADADPSNFTATTANATAPAAPVTPANATNPTTPVTPAKATTPAAPVTPANATTPAAPVTPSEATAPVSPKTNTKAAGKATAPK